MSAQSNRELIIRYYHDMWNKWDFRLAPEIVSNKIRFRGSLGNEANGLEAFLGYSRFVRSAFPDFSNEIEELVVDGCTVVARLKYRGTHQGKLYGFAPTGKAVEYSGVAIFKIAGGKIVEGWVLGDTANLMRQLSSGPDARKDVSNHPPFTIAPSTKDDREWAASLMARSEPWTTLGRNLEECRRACHSPVDMLFTARCDEQLCGFLLARRMGVADSPYIKSLAVETKFRNQGIGRELLKFAEDLFGAESRHIFLCVSSFNSRARRFYERHGYVAAGEFKDYLVAGASEILMCKRLTKGSPGRAEFQPRRQASNEKSFSL